MTAGDKHRGKPAALVLLLSAALVPVLGADENPTFRRLPMMDGSSVIEIGAPLPPELTQPVDGARRVSRDVELRVRVTDPDHHPLDVSFHARPHAAIATPFTFIHWSDTQYYAQDHPEILETITRWIHENAAARNIVFAPMSGDIVDNADQIIQWERADRAVRLLEPALSGYPDGVPFGVLPGNHDQFPREHADSTAAYNQYFGMSRFQERAHYGGSFDGVHNDHNFTLFEAGGMNFIAIFIGFDPDANPAVLAWADSLLTAHADRRAMVVSHYLIGLGDPGAFGAQGQATYDALKHHRNLFLMLCGDAHGEGRRVDVYNGSTVHTLLANYQGRDEGGEGWLRILEFHPAEDEIRISTYSPWLDQFETDADSEFVIEYDLDLRPPFTRLGTLLGVESGAEAAWTWPGRDANTEHEWYVTLTDGCHDTRGPTWSFTTEKMSGFTAYNDLAWGDGQLALGITRFTSPTGGSGHSSFGSLRDIDTDEATPVAVTVSGGTYDGVADALLGAEPIEGSDAHDIFAGRVSGVGQITYIDEPDTALTLAFSGMDSSRTYDLAFYAHRDTSGWDEASRVSLSGQLGFVNRSSTGLDDHHEPLFSGPDDPSTRLPADNDSGWVAWFGDVAAGADGEVVLTVEWDGTPGSEYRGKYGGALFVREFIEQLNRVPVLGDPGDQASAELEPVAVQIAAADPDDEDLFFEAGGLPPGLVIDDRIGLIEGMVSPGAAIGSPYVVNVSATDGAGATGWTGFMWRIDPGARRVQGPGFVLRPARPNPFRPATCIQFGVDEPTAAAVRIYDVGGRLVRTLFDDRVSAGEHEVTWDGRTGTGSVAGPGVYFYTLDLDGRRAESARLVRLR
jgi:3',5'-cyclic AMP phosphodiesterase CpdA